MNVQAGPSYASQAAGPAEAGKRAMPVPPVEPSVIALADAFARRFSSECSAMLQAPLQVRLAAVRRQTWSTAMAALDESTCVQFFRVDGCHAHTTAVSSGEHVAAADPITGSTAANAAAVAPNVGVEGGSAAAVQIASSVAIAIVERLMGGALPHAPIAARTLTSIERRVLGRVMDLAGRVLASIAPHESADGLAVTPVEASAATADSEAMVLDLAMALGECASVGRLCVDARLLAGGDDGAAAPARVGGPVEISVSLPPAMLSEGEAAMVSVDDLIVTDLPVGTEVIVRVAGIPKFIGRLGQCDGRRAVTILRKI